jgi:hypothetical protein
MSRNRDRGVLVLLLLTVRSVDSNTLDRCVVRASLSASCAVAAKLGPSRLFAAAAATPDATPTPPAHATPALTVASSTRGGRSRTTTSTGDTRDVALATPSERPPAAAGVSAAPRSSSLLRAMWRPWLDADRGSDTGMTHQKTVRPSSMLQVSSRPTAPPRVSTI